MTFTTPLLQVAGWTLLHFVWQGAAIAAATRLLLRLMERRSPNMRYAIACAGLIGMLVAPAATARVLWPTAV
jgi:bla regulator protein BlaR1